MPDDKDLISDFMKQFEEPESSPALTEINEPVQEPDIIPETADLQQNQSMQSPLVQQTNQPQKSLAKSVINYANGNIKCPLCQDTK